MAQTTRADLLQLELLVLIAERLYDPTAPTNNRLKLGQLKKVLATLESEYVEEQKFFADLVKGTGS